MTGPDDDLRRFVLETTAPAPVPHVPEIRCRTASDALDLWQRTEARAEATGTPPPPGPPFWAFPWAGGQGLARHLLDSPDAVRDRTVLDLACGCGLAGIAAALAGARDVLARDLDPLAVTATVLNAELNEVRLRAELADVTAGGSLLTGVAADPAEVTVLVGDVCYDRDVVALLWPLVLDAAAAGARVLVGDPGRAYLPRTDLRERSRHTVPVLRTLEDVDTRVVTVYEVARAPGVRGEDGDGPGSGLPDGARGR